MSRRIALWELIHTALLSVCIGATIMVGAAAAVAFPAMRKLDPKLPGIDGYTGEHWILTAGGIMAPAFRISGWVQYATVAGALLAFGVARWLRKNTRFSKLILARAIILMAILFLFSYQLITLRPRMDRNLNAIWASARSGDDSAATTAKAAFDADHGPARLVLEAGLGLTLVAIILAGWSMARATERAA